MERVIDKAIYMSGPLMSSKESYAEKRNALITYVEDQITHGVYQTRQHDVKTTDPITGVEKTITAVEIVADDKGMPRRQGRSDPDALRHQDLQLHHQRAELRRHGGGADPRPAADHHGRADRHRHRQEGRAAGHHRGQGRRGRSGQRQVGAGSDQGQGRGRGATGAGSGPARHQEGRTGKDGQILRAEGESEYNARSSSPTVPLEQAGRLQGGAGGRAQALPNNPGTGPGTCRGHGTTRRRRGRRHRCAGADRHAQRAKTRATWRWTCPFPPATRPSRASHLPHRRTPA